MLQTAKSTTLGLGWQSGMRVRLKGTNSVTKTKADGTTATYHYAWKGGPRLAGKPGSAEFITSYKDAHAAARAKADDKRLETVLDRYQDSSAFTDLAPRTRRDYAAILKTIRTEFGTMNVGALKQPAVKGIFRQWRDKIGKRSKRTADYSWMVLARVLSWALEGGLVEANPCEKGGRLYRGSRAAKVWSEAEIARFMAVARPEVALGMTLALWTGQRNGDLLSLPWSAYDGKHIRLEQSKTGARVVIPVGPTLRAVLDGLPRTSPIIMLSSAGRPWTTGSFRVAWHRTARAAKIEDRTFHDLRGTAINRLSLARATVPEIATITGHSLKDVQTILDKSYFHRDVALAESAMDKLEGYMALPTEFPTTKN